VKLSSAQTNTQLCNHLTLVDMKANIDTILVGSKVVLVPYRSEHVPVSDPVLLSVFFTEPSINPSLFTEIPSMDVG
jgi:hypothetical protein